MRKIKIIIADDNIHICKIIEKELSKLKNIEILAIVHTDEEEIKKIEELKPDIVITDIRRNNKDSGFEIIKSYEGKINSPLFFVISGSIVPYMKNIAGFMFKPIEKFDEISKEINRIFENKTKIYKEQ